MTAIFWSNDPTILFNKESMLQLWPTQKMTFESKLNAISRLIIVISILGFVFTRNFNLLIIGIITLAIIFTLYRLRKQKLVSSLKKEGFSLNSLKNSSSDNPFSCSSVNSFLGLYFISSNVYISINHLLFQPQVLRSLSSNYCYHLSTTFPHDTFHIFLQQLLCYYL